jgi:drug/metabolite transporter (DMT)-like permease
MPLRLIPLALALAWGLNWLAVKIMLTALPPFTLRAVGLGGVGVALLAAPVLPLVAALAFQVVVATAVAYVLWYRLLAHLGATVTSLTTLAVPVVGVLGAMLLVGDRPSAADGLGFALVLAGAALVVLQVPARR